MGALEPDTQADQPEPDEADELQETQSDKGQQRFRYRIVYSKDGPLRYTSQIDLARVWERVIRRAGLPLIYSQGFNPRPKIQLAVGLPLGYASQCEIVDVWLEREIPDLVVVIGSLNAAAPPGLVSREIAVIDVRAPSLQSIVRSTSYQVTFRVELTGAELARWVGELLAQPELWHERRDKRFDLRPLIDDLRVVTVPAPALEMSLAASATRGTARPDEILEMLGLDPAGAVVTRIAISFEPDEAVDQAGPPVL